MKIEIYGELLECGSVVKGESSITVLDEYGSVLREDSGICDFSGYMMIEGEWREREAEVSPEDRITALEEKNAELHAINIALEDALCEMDRTNDSRFVAIEDALCELDCME